MNRSQIRRMWILVVVLGFSTLIIVGRLVVFQLISNEYWQEVNRDREYTRIVDNPERGVIYDRNGAILAANGADYQIAASPTLISEKDRSSLALSLAPILEVNSQTILDELNSGKLYVILAPRISPELADAVRALPAQRGLEIIPLPRRYYPQNRLMSHLLGYVDFDGVGQSGVEGSYQLFLAGEAASANVPISPLLPQPNVIAQDGANLLLTIDRSVQHTVEKYLEFGLQEYGAVAGTIIVMDPRNGEILAMASKPDFHPYDYFNHPDENLTNPAVTNAYEPGSVMKLITMAAALDSGIVTPQSTYIDTGVLAVGGSLIYNWDHSAPGETDMTTLLMRSLNVGAGTLARWMGPDTYYDYMIRFNFGHRVGVDLRAEATGLMPLPGEAMWTEDSLVTNSYGQAMTTTPLQMISSVSALANDGVIMRPHVVKEIHRQDGEVVMMAPEEVSRPVSQQTAEQLTTMAVAAVRGEVLEAQVPGYTIAGKTGTAQIPEGGTYHPTDVIGSFIGWLPADNPELIVLVKIDRPQTEEWGSTTAAPIFSQLVTELVTILNIPPDEERLKVDVWQARQQSDQ